MLQTARVARHPHEMAYEYASKVIFNILKSIMQKRDTTEAGRFHERDVRIGSMCQPDMNVKRNKG